MRDDTSLWDTSDLWGDLFAGPSPAPPREAREEGRSIATAPPVLPRDTFEVHDGLRETTLSWFVVRKDNEAMRRVGQLLSSRAGVRGEPAGSLRDHAVAGLADLRHVQDVFQGFVRDREDCEDGCLGPREEHFTRRCVRFASDTRKVADRLEQKLGSPASTFAPGSYEETEGFRETTLARINDPEDRRLLRRAGALLWSMALEYKTRLPEEPEGWVCHRLRAAVADLRHLQGHLHHLGDWEKASLTEAEMGLRRFCRRFAGTLQRLADTLEQELNSWRGPRELAVEAGGLFSKIRSR